MLPNNQNIFSVLRTRTFKDAGIYAFFAALQHIVLN